MDCLHKKSLSLHMLEVLQSQDLVSISNHYNGTAVTAN
jgi:hypothetical protein